MPSEKAFPHDLVLDLSSFQLIRAGQPVKLEKTPMEVLTLLVRRQGALVTREEIIREVWGDAVHIDVDAGINTAIRKIRLALGDNPAAPRYLETAVGKGYRFIGPLTVVDPVAAVGSVDKAANDADNNAAHEDGKRSSLISRPQFRWKPIVAVAAGVAAVLLAATFVLRRNSSSPLAGPKGRVVIAVVPLENLSEDRREDYFADGLTDEILTQLGELNPERLGVMRYRSPAHAVQAVTGDFGQGVQYRLEGSVRRQGDEARISVRLMRAGDQTTIWAESFDRQVSDVLSLQSEIAQRIGRELQIQVLGRAHHASATAEVTEAYLRGRFELNGERPSDASRAYFEHAIALNPSYAPAYAGLADFYRKRAVGKDAGSEEAWQQAERYATHALSLDNDSAEAHSTIAEIKLMHDWDWPAAREHALRALQLNPSLPEAHSVYARYLRTAGKLEEAVNQRKQALALDPLRTDLKVQLTLDYFFARDYQAIVAAARRALAADPNDQNAHSDLCVSLGFLKSFDESIAECSKVFTFEGHADWVAAYVTEYHRRGYEAANSLIARKQLNDLLKSSQPDLWDLANAYVLAGMREEALRSLFQGLPTHEPGLLQIRVDPDFDSIRNEPRYAELVRRIGFPTE
jgi:TolB-like protein/DNA-binding winged helix-turn-helix (wHTH) protein/Tfp pilus assembly protein PilF